MTVVPLLEQLGADTPEGCCYVCERPLPAGRRRLCGEESCELAAASLYVRDSRRRKALGRWLLGAPGFSW